MNNPVMVRIQKKLVSMAELLVNNIDERPTEVDECLYTHVDEIKTIPTIVGRKYGNRKPDGVTFQRPWRLTTPPRLTEAFMTILKHNNMGFA